MKKIYVLAILMMAVIGLQAQTREDSLAIKQAALDYVAGWQSGDVDRVAKAVSPELAKRKVMHDPEGNYFITDMSASLLIQATRGNKNGVRMGDLLPDEPFNPEVKILSISGTVASVMTITRKYGFLDYIHLSKYDGEWKIINVLWEFLPKE
ncbi:MAG TPA: nuclear transport factor 2 family protein [Bacteroidales bacterium]|nr:nuclear transport factor 2 family protein [Bacteroidales bacterium]